MDIGFAARRACRGVRQRVREPRHGARGTRRIPDAERGLLVPDAARFGAARLDRPKRQETDRQNRPRTAAGGGGNAARKDPVERAGACVLGGGGERSMGPLRRSDRTDQSAAGRRGRYDERMRDRPRSHLSGRRSDLKIKQDERARRNIRRAFSFAVFLSGVSPSGGRRGRREGRRAPSPERKVRCPFRAWTFP